MAFVLRKQHINPKSPGSLPAEQTLAGKSQMLGGHLNPANPEAAGVFENMIWLNTSTSLNTQHESCRSEATGIHFFKLFFHFRSFLGIFRAQHYVKDSRRQNNF